MTDTDSENMDHSPCCGKPVTVAFYGRRICSRCRSEVSE